MRFESRTMLVTGGALGIGRATAERLAGEGAHAIVADFDREAGNDAVAQIEKTGGKAEFQFVDLSSEESIREMGAAVAGRHSALHGLVNNAGIIRTAWIRETGPEDWDYQVAVNLRAPILCARELLPILKEGPGHIVNVSSEGGFRARPYHCSYDVTKAGICSVTRTMACEFVEFGIRTNSVAPGWTVTEMHFLRGDDPDATKEELEDKKYGGAIIQRLGRPEEIAAAISFLLSDDASYITATTLHVDGGRVCH